MAKVQSDVLTITVSRLVKDSEPNKQLIPDDVVTDLEKVAQELLGGDLVVEVARVSE